MSRPTRADVARGRALVTGDPKDARMAARLADQERRLAQHIADAIAEAPPLTGERLERIARLLTGGIA